MRKMNITAVAAIGLMLGSIPAGIALAGAGGPSGEGIAIVRDASGANLVVVDPTRSGNSAEYVYALYGVSTDLVFAMDSNGDGNDTLALVRQDAGGGWLWIFDDNGDGTPDAFELFGTAATDTPIVGDFDPNTAGDEIGFTRPDSVNGLLEWYLKDNTPGPGFSSTTFGADTDTPIVGNFDGDANNGDEKGVTRADGSAKLFIVDTPGGPEFELFGDATDDNAIGDFSGDGTPNAGVRRAGPSLESIFILDPDTGGGPDFVLLGVSADRVLSPGNFGQP